MAGHTPDYGEPLASLALGQVVDRDGVTVLEAATALYGERATLCMNATAGLPDAFLASHGIWRTLEVLRMVRAEMNNAIDNPDWDAGDMIAVVKLINALLSELPAAEKADG